MPVGANQYDLSSIDLTAKNAEVALLNGENTHVYFKNATYHFDVKPGESDKRDLVQNLVVIFYALPIKAVRQKKAKQQQVV